MCIKPTVQQMASLSKFNSFVQALVENVQCLLAVLLALILPTSASAQQGVWSQIASTGYPGPLIQLRDWTSASFNSDARQICMIRPGGHADYGGADSWCIDLDNIAAGWQQIEPVQELTGPTQADGTCPYPVYGPGASHTYDGVPYIGNGHFLFLGSVPYCAHGMRWGTGAWVVDMTTPHSPTLPWIWTQVLQNEFTGYSITAVSGPYIYAVNGASKVAIINKNTLQIVDQTTGSNIGLDSAGSAAGVNVDGFFCVNDDRYMQCSKADGTIASFKIFVKRPVAVNAPTGSCMAQITGYNSMTPLPDGRFAIWNGGKRLIFFKPADDPVNDTCEVVEPATGPTDGIKGRIYEKLFWDSASDKLIGISNKDEGLWTFGLADAKPPSHSEQTPKQQPIPQPSHINGLVCDQYDGKLPYNFSPSCHQQEATAPLAAQRSTDYGLPPTATLAQLCSQAGTLLCDPLDDTPISGPAINGSTTLRTLSQALAARYGSWRRGHTAFPQYPAPMLDSGMGEGGSLKFTIASQSNAGGAGQYTVDVSPDYTLGVVQGETVRVRVKVRWSCDVLFTDCDPQSPTYKQKRRHYQVTSAFGGIKMLSIGEQDRNAGSGFIDSGEGLGLPVFHNGRQNGAYTAYIAIWSWALDALDRPANKHDRQPPRHCYWEDPINCHMMQADQWVTLQEDLYFGGCTRNANDPGKVSNVKLWVADEGQPFDLVIDSRINLRCTNIPNPKIGKVWLTPYNTAKDPSEVHPEGYVWYDDLWVSKLAE